MKDKLFSGLNKVNHVLLFLALTIAGINFIYSKIDHEEIPEIAIHSKIAKKGDSVSTKIGQVYCFNDVYFLQIRKDKIADSQNNLSLNMVGENFHGHEDDFNILNYFIVNTTTKAKYYLFDKDVLIIRSIISENNKETDIFMKNVFEIVNNDTNKNGYFDKEDTCVLFILNKNGTGLKKISSNLHSWNVLNKNKLLFAEIKNNKLVYNVYDATYDTIEEMYTISQVDKK